MYRDGDMPTATARTTHVPWWRRLRCYLDLHRAGDAFVHPTPTSALDAFLRSRWCCRFCGRYLVEDYS